MSDTISIIFHAHGLSDEENTKANFPSQHLQSTNQDAEVLNRFSQWMTAPSPLTGAKFKVKALFSSEYMQTVRVVGYLVEINIPACIIGNNVLLQNLVWSACRLAKLLLQYWLLTNGCSVAGSKAFPLTHAKLNSVTLTYLFPCEDHADALTANQEMFHQGEVLKNPRGQSKTKNPVFAVISSGNTTAYCKSREFKIASYVKSGPTSEAFAKFPSSADEDVVYAEGKKLVRVEIDLGKLWLSKNGLDIPAAWKNGTGDNPFKTGMQLIRQYFRLDEDLRTRRPKPVDIQKLSATDQDILNWHLSGKEARQHKRVKDKGNQYYSAVKLRLLKNLRIDITIPWREQSTKLSPRLSKLLTFTGRYRVPVNLLQHSFCVETVKVLIDKLKLKIKNEISQRQNADPSANCDAPLGNGDRSCRPFSVEQSVVTPITNALGDDGIGLGRPNQKDDKVIRFITVLPQKR